MRLAAILSLFACAASAIAQDVIPPSLDVVLDLERPSDTDVLLLRNGDRLTGTILNESFSIRTSYAQINLNNRVIAGIDLEGGASNIESIITVNDNRFSGFIDDPVFVFRVQSGPVIEVRREKVLKAVFRVREQEREGIPQRQYVTLKNGDYFTGQFLNADLIAATTYADIPLDLSTIERITFIGEANPLTTILLRNGDNLQGILNQEDMRFALDIGGNVEIYQDRINSVWLREGFLPSGGEPIADSPSRTSENAGSQIAVLDVTVSGQVYGDRRMMLALMRGVEWTSLPVVPSAVFWASEGTMSIPEDHSFDRRGALQLMAEAGYPDGYATQIIVTENDFFIRYAQILQALLASTGISASINVAPNRAAIDLMVESGIQLITFGE